MTKTYQSGSTDIAKDHNKPARSTKKTTSKKTSAKKSAAKKKPNKLEPHGLSMDKIKPGFPIVGIGASAGGLEAMEKFFGAMPTDSGMAFVLVTHLDPKHSSILPELLQKCTQMPVRQIEDGTAIKRNCAYVIPPNSNLTILHGTLQLFPLPERRGASLMIDTFFRSLAQDQRGNAIGIVLSGTGTDGTLGIKAIKGESGMVMVQDDASAKFPGMPQSALDTGVTDYQLPPEKMPQQLIAYTRHAGSRQHISTLIDDDETLKTLQKIFVLLRACTGHDFSLYKKNTIYRRIERRMSVHQIDDTSTYVRYLQDSDREIEALFKELLIGVTNFFRDPDAFDALQRDVLPTLLKAKPNDQPVRVWVPGCASGEEAYSVAIALHECMEQVGRHFHVQVFGTDIDESAIDVARAGIYPASIAADMEPDRLRRYFAKEEDGCYRVQKMIRDTLVFAPQSVIKDPPFTKLDLLCCRNLLIYLGAELQRKLFPVFHYSLKPGGILFLGSSETVGHATDLFTPTSKKWKLYTRTANSEGTRSLLDFPPRPATDHGGELEIPEAIQKAEELSALQMLKSILNQSHTPPCAIINDAGNTVFIHGRTGRFLEPAEGKASVNIIDMARVGLAAELSAAIRHVAAQKQPIVCRNLRVHNDAGELLVTVTVKPMPEQAPMRGLMMVTFEQVTSVDIPDQTDSNRLPPNPQGKSFEEIEHELQDTRENLQSTVEELETANEELKSTNEEIQSTNEELQSTNEELETSKEELQSLNEESATVNAELQARIDELSGINDDMKNLLESTDIATLFLDTEMRIRRFTSSATKIMPLTTTDCGRPIGNLVSSLVDANLTEYGFRVLEDLVVRESEVHSDDNRCYSMRVRPYRTVTNVIEGVVITFHDITDFKRVETALRESEAQIRTAVLHSGVIFAQTDLNLRYVWIYNPQPDFNPEAVIGKRDDELADHNGAMQLLKLKRDVIDSGQKIRKDIVFPLTEGQTVYDVIAEPIRDDGGQVVGVVTCALDITELVHAQQQQHDSDEHLRALFELVGDAIILFDPDTLRITDSNDKAHQNLGYTREEFTALSLTDIDALKSYADITSHIEAVLRGGAEGYQTTHKGKDGKAHNVNVKISAIGNEGSKRLMAALQYSKSTG